MNEVASQQITDFLTTPEHCLVSGGPGSGKTTLALKKAVARITAGMKPGQAVLFLSFSRAAVSRLVEAGSQSIPRSYRDNLAVQTFHSLFWNLLACHAYLLGAPYQIQILMPHDERAISRGIKTNHPDWPAWERERERLFFCEGRIAFDLFAPMTLRLIRASAAIKNLIAQQYPLIIVDEAQDTGNHSWEFMRELKDIVQIVCLVDPEQQIFDHLPGVGPERIETIRKELAPMEVDLGQQNNRSPGTEIAVFANDIMHRRPRGAAYAGVSRLTYHHKHDLNLTLRKSLAIVYRKARAMGIKPESCAILATTGPQVAEITAALSNGDRPVPHKVVFDEAQALLASRFGAFLLEPHPQIQMKAHLIESLKLVADVERSAGTEAGRKLSDNCHRWASEYAGGKKLPNKGLPGSILSVIEVLRMSGFCGDPRVDWMLVKNALRNCDDKRLAKVAGYLDYLVAFGRGRFLA
jgi:DNA helicase II / ATP-dependent DNA helicase PcrA